MVLDITIVKQTLFSEEEKSLPQFDVSMSAEYHAYKIITSSDKLSKIKQNMNFSPIESIKVKNNIQVIKKDSIEKPFVEKKNIPINKDSEEHTKFVQKRNDCKRKRPRISIISDDEDEKNENIRLKAPETSKEILKQKTKELPKKCNKITMSQVIVVKVSKLY